MQAPRWTDRSVGDVRSYIKMTLDASVLLFRTVTIAKSGALTTKNLFVSLNSDLIKSLFMAFSCARNSA